MTSIRLFLATAIWWTALPPSPAGPPAFPEPARFESRPARLGDGSAELLAVVYSPNGELLATAGADQKVRLWDATTGQPVAALTGHEDAVAGLAFSPDG